MNKAITITLDSGNNIYFDVAEADAMDLIRDTLARSTKAGGWVCLNDTYLLPVSKILCISVKDS